jgi:hypothetical protein
LSSARTSINEQKTQISNQAAQITELTGQQPAARIQIT